MRAGETQEWAFCMRLQLRRGSENDRTAATRGRSKSLAGIVFVEHC